MSEAPEYVYAPDLDLNMETLEALAQTPLEDNTGL